MHIEERRTIDTEGRGFSESIQTKTKQKKTNVITTPEKDDMTSANQTPGGYKFELSNTTYIIAFTRSSRNVVDFSATFQQAALVSFSVDGYYIVILIVARVI